MVFTYLTLIMRIPGYHEHDLLINCQFMLVTALPNVNVALLENVQFLQTTGLQNLHVGQKVKQLHSKLNTNLDLNNTQHSWHIEY